MTFRQIDELYRVHRDEKGNRIPFPDPWLSDEELERQAAVNFLVGESMEREEAIRKVYGAK